MYSKSVFQNMINRKFDVMGTVDMLSEGEKAELVDCEKKSEKLIRKICFGDSVTYSTSDKLIEVELKKYNKQFRVWNKSENQSKWPSIIMDDKSPCTLYTFSDELMIVFFHEGFPYVNTDAYIYKKDTLEALGEYKDYKDFNIINFLYNISELGIESVEIIRLTATISDSKQLYLIEKRYIEEILRRLKVNEEKLQLKQN